MFMSIRRMYTGYDSVGRFVTVAEGVNRIWYATQFGWDGSFEEPYQTVWSEMEPPNFYNPEELHLTHSENKIEWGDSVLNITPNTTNKAIIK